MQILYFKPKIGGRNLRRYVWTQVFWMQMSKTYTYVHSLMEFVTRTYIQWMRILYVKPTMVETCVVTYEPSVLNAEVRNGLYLDFSLEVLLWIGVQWTRILYFFKPKIGGRNLRSDLWQLSVSNTDVWNYVDFSMELVPWVFVQ